MYAIGEVEMTREQAARKAALTRWARCQNRTAATAAARAAFLDKHPNDAALRARMMDVRRGA